MTADVVSVFKANAPKLTEIAAKFGVLPSVASELFNMSMDEPFD